MLTSISPDRLENLRSRIERAEDAAKRLDGDIGRMWAERYAGDVAFLLGLLPTTPSPEAGTASVPTLGPVEDGEWCHFCGGWSESDDEDMCTSCGDDNIVTRQYRRIPKPNAGQQETLTTWALCPRCGDRVVTKFEAGPPWNGKTVFVAHAAKGSSPRVHCRESGQAPPTPAAPAAEPVTFTREEAIGLSEAFEDDSSMPAFPVPAPEPVKPPDDGQCVCRDERGERCLRFDGHDRYSAGKGCQFPVARTPAASTAGPGKPPATCASWCGGKTEGALVFCSDACFIAHANRARSPAAGTAPPLAFGMRTAREVAAEVWDSLKRGENVIDMYAAAIEQDRREMIAACREVAEEGVCSFGTDYSARCAHTACAVKRTIGRRIRSLVLPPRAETRP